MFSTLIKNAREKLGWSQQQLSDESGVSRDTIANIERRRQKRVYFDTLARLAQALGLSLDEMAGDDDD